MLITKISLGTNFEYQVFIPVLSFNCFLRRLKVQIVNAITSRVAKQTDTKKYHLEFTPLPGSTKLSLRSPVKN